MKGINELSTVIGAVVCAAFMSASFAAPIKTASGLVSGVTSDGLIVFKGIPFAAPPVGDLRWRAPRPVTPWTGVRKADRFPPECMQTGSYPPDAPPEATSEDCLYLNIWKPVIADNTKLPVMVWIYGGGLANGSASTLLYAGDMLARKGVIVVTLNYRLGVFGFLADPALTKESPHHSSGNYGLLDQIVALKWIHDNIAAFGGDPDRVTVFGQSSGSISISALTASPLTKGLFQRAIGESGGLFEPMNLAPQLTLAGAEQQGQRFMTRAGADSLQALRKLSAAKLLKTPFTPGLIIDGYAITHPPYDVYRDGKQHDVALLIGSNADEGQIFITGHKITPGNLDQELERDGFPDIVVKLLGPRIPATDQEARTAAASFNKDMRFRWDMWTWANLATQNNRQKVFFYQFDRSPPFPKDSIYAGLGATHGMEMPYVFGHLDLRPAAWTADDRRLSETMLTYLTNFAKYGDPNGAGLPVWPEYTRQNPQLMYLGREIKPGPVKNEAALVRISHFYATARFVMSHVYSILAVVVLLLILLITGVVVIVRRWRLRRNSA